MNDNKHIQKFNEHQENLNISDASEIKISQIKNQYLDIDKQLNELHKKQNELSKSIREILDNETDIGKRKEIIDFVFSDGVEEIHEYALRKMYI